MNIENTNLPKHPSLFLGKFIVIDRIETEDNTIYNIVHLSYLYVMISKIT